MNIESTVHNTETMQQYLLDTEIKNIGIFKNIKVWQIISLLIPIK